MRKRYNGFCIDYVVISKYQGGVNVQHKMYSLTDYRDYDNYDYCIGNTDKLPEKLKEMVRKNVKDYIDKMIQNSSKLADTLIIAGDISNDNTHSKEFLTQASKIWKNVWYTDGNHDYYFQDKEVGDNRLYRLIEDLKNHPNIKYVADTVQETVCEEKTVKIGFLPLMYNMGDLVVNKMFNIYMNDVNFINPDYVYDSYKKGSSFYEKNIYGKCDVCVSHVPVLRLKGSEDFETTYFTKLNLDPGITYFFGHTHKNEKVTNYLAREDGPEIKVMGYNIGVGYPNGRGLGIPHTRTFDWSGEGLVEV